MKLRTVREAKLRRLLGHRAPNRGHAMPDVYDCGLPRCVQVFTAVNGGNPAAFTGSSNRVVLSEIARKERWMIRHGVRILAEQRQAVSRRAQTGRGCGLP